MSKNISVRLSICNKGCVNLLQMELQKGRFYKAVSRKNLLFVTYDTGDTTPLGNTPETFRRIT